MKKSKSSKKPGQQQQKSSNQNSNEAANSASRPSAVAESRNNQSTSPMPQANIASSQIGGARTRYGNKKVSFNRLENNKHENGQQSQNTQQEQTTNDNQNQQIKIQQQSVQAYQEYTKANIAPKLSKIVVSPLENNTGANAGGAMGSTAGTNAYAYSVIQPQNQLNQTQVMPAPLYKQATEEQLIRRENRSALSPEPAMRYSPFSTRALQNANRIAAKQPTINMESVTLHQTVSLGRSICEDDEDESDQHLWRNYYDTNQIYRLEKKLKMTDERDEHLKQIKRWRDNDQKGNRHTYYVKEVQKRNADIMTIVDQTRLERAHSKTDGHKCLNLRKKILKFRIHVSDASMMVTSSKYFEGFIIVVIGLNCITLAQSDSTKEETAVEKNIDLTFNIIYTIEMFLRIFSLGFIFGPSAYMKSLWCQLDFICVTTAYLELAGGGGTSLGGLRAFRVLRPLRFVNNIQGLKSIVQSIMKAIPVLKDTILVLFFFFLIFAIGGLNLFMGQLKQRCINEMTGDTLLDDEGEETLCGSSSCPEGYFCGKKTLNPNNDTTNFDNIFWALLNVFQCITLEGWSEIMVMYQKAYSPLTFFFFVPMVFIGAFFLLNLTLAVIQSTYQQTKSETKAAKLKLKQEQEEMARAAVSQPDDDGQGGDQDDDDGPAKRANIGVAAFFIARRAANKMKKFWKRHQRQEQDRKVAEEKKAVEDKKKEQAQEKAEMLRRSKALKKQLTRKKVSSFSVSPDKKGLNATQKSDKSSVKSNESSKAVEEIRGAREDTYELAEQYLQEVSDEQVKSNKTITEEDAFSQDNYSQDVENFLKQVASDPSASVPPIKVDQQQRGNTPAGSKTLRTNTRMTNPIMAFNDVRISQPARIRAGNMTFDRGFVPQNAAKRNNYTSKENGGQKPGAQGQQSKEVEMAANLQADLFFEELDFEKVVKKNGGAEYRVDGSPRNQVEASARQNPNNADNLWDVEFPVDLSLSEGGGGRGVSANVSVVDPKRHKLINEISDDDDLKSSIISSDESINAKITKMDFTDDNPLNHSRGLTRISRKELRQNKLQKTQEVNNKVKRMLTSDFVKQNANESQQNFLQSNNPSIRQQLDCLSNLQINAETSSVKKKAGYSSIMTDKDRNDRTEKTRTQGAMTGTMISQQDPRATIQSNQSRINTDKRDKIKIYHDLGEYFNNTKPVNPLSYIDTIKQKVMINPGVPYVSTSQNEIFERRNILFQKEMLNKINPYIAAPKEDEVHGQYEGNEEETYIRSVHQAYQMKTLYKVQQIDEIELDSDDEDALILAQQPFETVMQTGFKDYLNHLNTKFIARRSDIIVSSTLSITLTPLDDQFMPIQFANVDQGEIWDYVMKRQEYRAFQIESNTLPKFNTFTPGNQIFAGTDSSISKTDNDQPESAMDYSAFEDQENKIDQTNTDGKSSAGGGLVIKLPDTLQSEPLDPKKVPFLSLKQRRMYNIQKMKHEQQLKTNGKKMVHPRDQVFDLITAQQLVKGTYHKDEDEDDYAEIKVNQAAEEGKQILNRAMNNFIHSPAEELNLDNFETKLIDSLQESQVYPQQDPRKHIEYVPQDIKNQFDLRVDMNAYEIDFELVRSNDVQFKKQQPIWSGQEVLDVGLNIKKSQWILSKMNKMRVWPKGLYNTVKKVRCLMKQFIRLSIFENFLTLCVLFNTIVMAMDSYDIDEKTKTDLEFLNKIFTYIFIVEMSLKLLARGPKKYAREPMNLLDGGVVILSIVEIVMAALGGGSGAGSLQAFRTVRVFRTFRVLRVTRILRALKSMAQVIGVIQRTFMEFVLITILMFVFIFIYTLLGRQIFQGKYDFGPDAEMPRAHFDSFTVAFITVFQVLTMENWQQVLFNSIRACENQMIMKTVTAVYYISWIFIGNFILLNLFLAILIEGFQEEEANDEEDEENQQLLEAERKLKQQRLKESKDKRMKKLGTSAAELNKMKTVNASQTPQKKKKKEKQRANFTGTKKLREEDLDDIEDMNSEEIRELLVQNGILKARKTDKIDFKLVGPEIMADNSLYLFSRHSCFRRNIHFIQKHHYFESFIMLLIALSSVKLAMESYFVDADKDSTIVTVSEELDYVFNYLFNVECVLKVIALGFAMDEGSYLRDSWNKLDFFIVVTSNIDMILKDTDIPALKVLRMLRMIRPLRVISHNPQLKMIVAALFESFGSIVNVSFIVLIIWLMFAIYGMNTFMGMFFYCSEEPYKYNTEWVCQDHGGKWLKHDSNFDDIGQAMMTLFIIASLEGWPDIMYQAIDVTKTDNGPQYEASPGYAGFFIIFILIGSFFFLNFFTGVLMLKYEEAQRREEAGFNKQQLYWLEIQKLIVDAQTPHELRYKPLHRGMRYNMWRVVVSNQFDYAIMTCIVLNMFQMSLDHDGASPSILSFLQVTNIIFTAIFFLEAVFKILVYRWAYFKTGWNKFDFFVVVSSLIDLAIDFALPKPEGGQSDAAGNQIFSVGPQLARVLRVLRVSRVLRLAGKNKGLQSLLKTIMMSIDSLFNVFILLMLIFFIMAVLGNTMFYNVYEGNVIDEYKNFTNFHMSFSLLFSISTGEDWNRIMYDTMDTSPECIPDKTCGSNIAPIFFLSFIMIVSNVMLNLFILVIIMQFQKFYLEDDNPLARFEADFKGFKEAWAKFTDQYSCIKMKPKNIPEFFRALPAHMRQRIGFSEMAKDEEINRIILKMGINVDDGFIYFHEMLYRLMRAQFVTRIGLKFNKVMTISELVTQYKIAEITLKNKTLKKVSRNALEEFYFQQNEAMPVNLFLTKMFYKTSFKTWRNVTKKHALKDKWNRKQQQERERCEMMHETFIEQPYEEVPIEPEYVEIEREEFSDWTVESDEDIDDNDTKSKKSFATQKLHSEWTKSQKQQDSPEWFRQKARLRMSSNQKKFTIILDDTLQAGSSQLNQSRSMSKRGKREKVALICHSEREAEATANHKFIDPNSMAYQNAVLENKINRHQKAKKSQEGVTALGMMASMRQSFYKGQYSSEKNVQSSSAYNSPSRINAPPRNTFSPDK